MDTLLKSADRVTAKDVAVYVVCHSLLQPTTLATMPVSPLVASVDTDDTIDNQ